MPSHLKRTLKRIETPPSLRPSLICRLPFEVNQLVCWILYRVAWTRSPVQVWSPQTLRPENFPSKNLIVGSKRTVVFGAGLSAKVMSITTFGGVCLPKDSELRSFSVLRKCYEKLSLSHLSTTTSWVRGKPCIDLARQATLGSIFTQASFSPHLRPRFLSRRHFSWWVRSTIFLADRGADSESCSRQAAPKFVNAKIVARKILSRRKTWDLSVVVAPTKLIGPIITKQGKLGDNHHWGSGQDSLVSAWQVPEGLVRCFCLESGVKSMNLFAPSSGCTQQSSPFSTHRVKR